MKQAFDVSTATVPRTMGDDHAKNVGDTVKEMVENAIERHPRNNGAFVDTLTVTPLTGQISIVLIMRFEEVGV